MAYNFDGISKHINLGQVPLVGQLDNDNHAVSVWVFSDSVSTDDQYLFSYSVLGDGDNIGLRLVESDDGSNPNKLSFHNGVTGLTDEVFSNDAWSGTRELVNVIAGRDAGVLKMYVAGTIQTDTTPSTRDLDDTASHELHIGANANGSNLTVAGKLAEIAVWNDKFPDAAEALEIWNDGRFSNLNKLPTFDKPIYWSTMDDTAENTSSVKPVTPL